MCAETRFLMHKLAREHVSEWRHLHGNMSLDTNHREIRRQSAHRHVLLCETLHRRVRKLKSRVVTRRVGYINGKIMCQTY